MQDPTAVPAAPQTGYYVYSLADVVYVNAGAGLLTLPEAVSLAAEMAGWGPFQSLSDAAEGAR